MSAPARPLPEITQERADVFWSKIKIQSESECWLWTDSTCDGYGHFGIWNGEKVHTVKAHRLAFRLWWGADPFPTQVLHACDVRACCNPFHMFLGDETDNNRDCEKKGRRPHGEKHGAAKLKDREIITIASLKPFRTAKSLSEEFGVGKQHIYDICSGKTRRDVLRPVVRGWAKKSLDPSRE